MNTLIDNHPDFTKDITDRDLCLPVITTNSCEQNRFPLFWLLMNKGHAVFKKLLMMNPELGKTISARDLCSRNAQYDSCLFSLILMHNNYDLLTLLTDRNPALINNMSLDQLCTIFIPVKNTKWPAFSLLSLQEENHALLQRFVAAHQANWPEKKLLVCLMQPITDNGVTQSFLPLQYLIRSPIGRLILADLFTHVPKLAPIIPWVTEPLTQSTFCESILVKLLKYDDGTLFALLPEKIKALVPLPAEKNAPASHYSFFKQQTTGVLGNKSEIYSSKQP